MPEGFEEMSNLDKKRVLAVLSKVNEDEFNEGRKLWAFDNWIREADDRKTIAWLPWILEQINAADEAAYEIYYDL